MRPALALYVSTVILGFIIGEVLLLTHTKTLRPPSWIPVIVLVALATLAELRPIKTNGRWGVSSVSVSYPFSIPLFFVAPLPLAAGLYAVSLTPVFLFGRGLVWFRAFFNVAQHVIAVALATYVFEALGFMPPPGQTVGLGQVSIVACVLAVGGTAHLLNHALVFGAFALAERRPYWPLVVEATRLQSTLTVLQVGVSPIFLVLIHSGRAIAILTGVLILTLWKTAQAAIRHRHEAEHDPLTRLLNHHGLVATAPPVLHAADKAAHHLLVLRVDLSGFQGIIDRLGMDAGNLVLQQVALRLTNLRRSGDLVARLNRDEFAILLSGPCSADDAVEIASRVTQAFCDPISVDGMPLAIEPHVGVAEYPTHGSNIETLMAAAEAALYRSKKDNNGPEVYQVGAYDHAGPGRWALVAEINDAMERNEFVLLYQPKLQLATNAVVGVEALIRWNHPTRGLLYPDDFIPAAEESEVIHELTAHVLKLALTQCSKWQAEGLHLSVAVNVSSRNMLDRNFVRRVTDQLERCDVDPKWLEIEITENTVMTNPERTAFALQQLRNLGVRVAIDDFGTGFSPLRNLVHLPADVIKIDKSFVMTMDTEPRRASIVKSLIDLAGQLGLGVVAEGVETELILDRLRAMGCDMIQGYHLGRPMPALDVEAMCKTNLGQHL